MSAVETSAKPVDWLQHAELVDLETDFRRAIAHMRKPGDTFPEEVRAELAPVMLRFLPMFISAGMEEKAAIKKMRTVYLNLPVAGPNTKRENDFRAYHQGLSKCRRSARMGRF